MVVVNVVVSGNIVVGGVVVGIVGGVVVDMVVIVVTGNVLGIGMLFCLNSRFLNLFFFDLLNFNGIVVFVIGVISLVDVDAIVIVAVFDVAGVVLPGIILVGDMVLRIGVVVVGNLLGVVVRNLLGVVVRFLLIVVIVFVGVFKVNDGIVTGVFVSGNIVIGDTLHVVVVMGAIIVWSDTSLNRSI